jgi:anaerobic magnesium-protoporphyrin IX monomethyl ester cyclase
MPTVTLVGPELEENLSLRYLASSLAACGFECLIVPFDCGADLARVVRQVAGATAQSFLVGLSLAFQPRARDFLALAVALRQQGYRGHLTGGGHFATFACREILRDFPEFDTIVRHEAEQTLPLLAGAVLRREDPSAISGVVSRDRTGFARVTPLPPPEDLADLPWPDRRGTASRYLGHPLAPIVGSHGCYARCAFCCIAAWHEQTVPPTRFRLRPVNDLADEMAWLRREKGIDVFIFHDDNFFLPGRDRSLARIHALGDALDRRGVSGVSTVVKARPNDLDEQVVTAMQERLGLIRVFVGIESDAHRGLRTLGRGVLSEQNHRALDLLQQAGVYACFNLLVFDPSTRLDDLEVNLRFMERYAEVPHNFGRVELYAGTPLLARLQAERRCSGDYLEWDYAMADADVQRVFEIAMSAFYVRNFDKSIRISSRGWIGGAACVADRATMCVARADLR